MDAHIWDVF
jgi:hypothetical protein